MTKKSLILSKEPAFTLVLPTMTPDEIDGFISFLTKQFGTIEAIHKMSMNYKLICLNQYRSAVKKYGKKLPKNISN